MEAKQHPFNKLAAVSVNEHTETKNGLTYLSWAWAWSEVKKLYPDASYTVYKDGEMRPYIEDKDFGIMVYTTVTIGGQTHEMWLPVMDGANKAMRRTPYTYKVWNKMNRTWDEKKVEAATMFDINKTIMRCLTKNLAMFGLGLYIYAGEDLPMTTEQETAEIEQKPTKTDDKWEKEALLEAVRNCTDPDDLTKIWNTNKAKWGQDKDFTEAVAASPCNPNRKGAKK